MPTTARPPVSPDDANGIQVSLLARQALRALKLARVADRRDARAIVCIREGGDMYGWMSREAQVEHAELEALVALAVASLPLMCRWVFLIVRDDDASYAAIALTLGVTRHTVKEHLPAAQRHLPAARVDAGVIAPPVPLACPPRVTETPNDMTAQPVDPVANRQDSAA